MKELALALLLMIGGSTTPVQAASNSGIPKPLDIPTYSPPSIDTGKGRTFLDQQVFTNKDQCNTGAYAPAPGSICGKIKTLEERIDALDKRVKALEHLGVPN